MQETYGGFQDKEYSYYYLDYSTSSKEDDDYYSYEEEFVNNFKKYSHQDLGFNYSDSLLHYHHGEHSSIVNYHVIDANLLVICSLVAILAVMVTIVIVIFRRQNKAMHREHILIHQCLPTQYRENDENDAQRLRGEQSCVTKIYQL